MIINSDQFKNNAERQLSITKEGSRELPQGLTVRAMDLQKRDLEILQFLNEMGPATSQLVAAKFFNSIIASRTHTRLRIARRRLQLLRQSGFIQKDLWQLRRPFYLTTQKGVQALCSHLNHCFHLSHLKNVPEDMVHSLQVIWSRIALENMGLATEWRSERRIGLEDKKDQLRQLNKIQKVYIPDGVYVRSDGAKILFEYEHTQKSQARIKERSLILTNLVVSMKPHYQGVHIVCANESILARYKPEIRIWDQKIQTFEQLMTEGGINHVWTK
jgi:hypothetical protein